MPVWRPRPDWLRAAVDAVLADDLAGTAELELLVVDDGNDEPVAPLLAAVDDPRLRVLRAAHGGASHARNEGIAAARGELLRFVDADDVVAPGGTAALVAAVDGARVIAYGSSALCDEALQMWELRSCTVRGDAVTACLVGELTVLHPAMVLPRAVVEEIGGWHDWPTCEDWDFVLRAVEVAPVVPVDRVVYSYRRSDGSLAKQTRDLAGEVGRAVVREHFVRHPDERGTARHRRTEAYLRQRELHRFSDSSPWTKAAWWRAAATNPSYVVRMGRDGATRWRRRVARAVSSFRTAPRGSR